MGKHRLSYAKADRKPLMWRVGELPRPPRPLRKPEKVFPPQPPPPPPVASWAVFVAHMPPPDPSPAWLYIEAYCTDGTILKHCAVVGEIDTNYGWLDDWYETYEATYVHLAKKIVITLHYWDGRVEQLEINVDIYSGQMNGQEPPTGWWGIHDEYETSQ